jgi:hypothetical protein
MYFWETHNDISIFSFKSGEKESKFSDYMLTFVLIFMLFYAIYSNATYLILHFTGFDIILLSSNTDKNTELFLHDVIDYTSMDLGKDSSPQVYSRCVTGDFISLSFCKNINIL